MESHFGEGEICNCNHVWRLAEGRVFKKCAVAKNKTMVFFGQKLWGKELNFDRV